MNYLKMKGILIALSILLIFQIGCTSSKKALSNTESIKFEITKPNLKAIKIVEGDKIEITTSIKNIGEVPVRIVEIRGSCGCVVPEWSSDEIEPNQESPIIFHYDSRGKGTIEGKENNYKVWLIISGEERVIDITTTVYKK